MLGCGLPPLITKGNVTCSDTIEEDSQRDVNCNDAIEGSHAQYSCLENRIIEGGSVIECLNNGLNNGSWSGRAPLCLGEHVM